MGCLVGLRGHRRRQGWRVWCHCHWCQAWTGVCWISWVATLHVLGGFGLSKKTRDQTQRSQQCSWQDLRDGSALAGIESIAAALQLFDLCKPVTWQQRKKTKPRPVSLCRGSLKAENGATIARSLALPDACCWAQESGGISFWKSGGFRTAKGWC